MKKNGFTLAEVLITFAIIGIVAAITLPGLNNGVNKSKIGPALAKAVNTLETANKVALLEYDVIGIDNINMDVDKMTADGNCEKDSEGQCVKSEGNYLQKISLQLSGHTTIVNGKKDVTKFTLKDGMSYELHANTSTSTPKSVTGKLPDGKYRYKYYVVYIDTNGAKTPNQKGQDQFMVYVDTAGTVIAAGSKEA